MKIIQVNPDVSAESAGPTYYILNLCRILAELGNQIELHVCKSSINQSSSFFIKEHHMHSFPHPALKRSPEMLKSLKKSCQNAGIIHCNELWTMPNIYPAQAIKGTDCKIVMSPHGGLAPWALKHHRLRKIISFWVLGQGHTLKKISMFHATSMKEYYEIRAAGYRQPVAVIPIGIDIPKVIRPRGNRRKLLFLGRIHPVKAVDRLLKAWSMVSNEFPEWDFQIVGPNCGLEKTLRDMVNINKIPRTEFIGEQHGMEKFKYYAAADLYVLPSFTENFGVTVAESLASGTPVIVSDSIPWHDVKKYNCGWISDNHPDALATILHTALKLPRKTLEHMGENGKCWMQREYSWSEIGKKMQEAYQWLLGEIAKPDFIMEE